jgi:hypothetical protein
MTTDFDNSRTNDLDNGTTSIEPDEPDARVEQLAGEIDETRGDLTETIQAIGEKLEPSNLAREASETVKATTRGKVEQMNLGAQETWRDVTTGNTGGIVDTIKSNPIPAGMVAAGIGMLFMNRGKQSQRQQFGRTQSFEYGSGLPGDHGYTRSSSWEPAQWDRRSGGSPLDRVGSTVSGAAESAGSTMDHVAGQAGEKVGQVADSVGQAAGEIPQQAGYVIGQGAGQLRRFIDEYPLGAGAVAVAAGAALGVLLPSTRIERETIGQARDQFVDQAESTVHDALDKVEETQPA